RTRPIRGRGPAPPHRSSVHRTRAGSDEPGGEMARRARRARRHRWNTSGAPVRRRACEPRTGAAYPGGVTQSVPVLLSTTSVYPEPTSVGFELAAELGNDGVELMVFTDRISQDPSTAASLSRHYGVKIGAVHAPCLLVTHRVWIADPWTRLRRSVQAAEYLEAPTVVIHPPF